MRPVPARPTSSINTVNPLRHTHPTRPSRRRPSLRLAGASLEIAIGPSSISVVRPIAVQRLTGVAIRPLLPTLLSTPPALAAGLPARADSIGAAPEATWTAVPPPAVSRQRPSDASERQGLAGRHVERCLMIYAERALMGVVS